ncbi:MAG: ATP-binding protein [Parabacteroides sp.]
MKFYDREKELASLAEMRSQAFTDHSRLTVVTGRRRIGKTSLILKSCEQSPTVYLFVSRSNESILCAKFAKVISESLGVFVSPEITRFADIFTTLMELGKKISFNLVIDEFQEFFHINESVYSDMQCIWDLHKDTTHVNWIASGSVYSLMHRIFLDYSQPLYGRCDRVMKIGPFETAVLKTILSDYSPAYKPDDLLALYTFTGGVPKYISILMDNGCFTMEAMVRQMIQPYSIFLEEGNILLIQEFGKKFGNYYSILSSIANGRNTITEITEDFGKTSIGGHLKRLEEDYEVISKKRPVMAKEATQTVRYEITDNFMRFWFRYIVKYQDYIQANSLEALASLIIADYPTYSGLLLEKYFRQQLIESGRFRLVGSWWESSKGNKKGKERPNDQHEIDVVAVYALEERVLIAEVKRQRKNYKPELLQQKVELIRTKLFYKYALETVCLTLEDM